MESITRLKIDIGVT